jgi:hypothetical protein
VTGCPERGSLRATPSPVYDYVHVEDEAAFHNAVTIPPAVQALRQSRFPRFGEDAPSSNRWQSGYLCSGGQQFFGKRANQSGIDTGKFIDLLPDTLKIIVIAGYSPVGSLSPIGFSQRSQSELRDRALLKSASSSAQQA